MREAANDVVGFMRAVGQLVRDRPGLATAAETALRAELINEEAAETVQALESGDLAGIADGCIDLIYVAIGCMLAHGIDPQCVWDAVHKANMAKASGPVRPDGKRLKPPGWTPPDVASALDAQANVTDVYPARAANRGAACAATYINESIRLLRSSIKSDDYRLIHVHARLEQALDALRAP